ncbi:uncharacterized protein SETTUDRAFT_169517 [Exserohilum turcica Et28A]|uniref:Uncharacterized protein n=1 Tax=Exserohilum turcicum (strain 28A) TaxID=671987 RepID=R0K928_EXST2|nr:uncharacterized protein SETTUDRAFT_169517 [Exserohilum turcica Et28A]EOA85954.1 hypothetical protein SETTUDRAFT_169517 [Exserohilum turcica Et28A]
MNLGKFLQRLKQEQASFAQGTARIRKYEKKYIRWRETVMAGKHGTSKAAQRSINARARKLLLDISAIDIAIVLLCAATVSVKDLAVLQKDPKTLENIREWWNSAKRSYLLTKTTRDLECRVGQEDQDISQEGYNCAQDNPAQVRHTNKVETVPLTKGMVGYMADALANGATIEISLPYDARQPYILVPHDWCANALRFHIKQNETALLQNSNCRPSEPITETARF